MLPVYDSTMTRLLGFARLDPSDQAVVFRLQADKCFAPLRDIGTVDSPSYRHIRLELDFIRSKRPADCGGHHQMWAWRLTTDEADLVHVSRDYFEFVPEAFGTFVPPSYIN